jgi:hypothetical protein
MIVAYLLSVQIICCESCHVEHCVEHGEFLRFNTANTRPQRRQSRRFFDRLFIFPRHFTAMPIIGVSSEQARSALGRQFWFERLPNILASRFFNY